jgi:hypothetical protein
MQEISGAIGRCALTDEQRKKAIEIFNERYWVKCTHAVYSKFSLSDDIGDQTEDDKQEFAIDFVDIVEFENDLKHFSIEWTDPKGYWNDRQKYTDLDYAGFNEAVAEILETIYLEDLSPEVQND